MKIGFKNSTPEESVAALESNLSGRKLGSMVSLELDSKKLTVVISKLGKSKLNFSIDSRDSETFFKLDSEKIALSHRALKDSVLEKLEKVIRD